MEDDVISIDTLSDRSSPELEIVSSEVATLTPKELRIKLLNFLVVSPPPSPVRWKSFKEFVTFRFKDYYPKDVIADVYDQLQTAWSSKKQPSADSDADTERHSNSSEASTSQIKPRINGRPVRQAVSIKVQATQNDSDEDSPDVPCCSTSDSPQLLSKREIRDICNNDSAVKKRSNYIKEMYAILDSIQNSTSCGICKKLKYRLDKFREYLSEESLSIRKKVLQRRSGSYGNVEIGHHPLQNFGRKARSKTISALSVDKSETMLRDYLTKKVIEASMPGILKMTEARMEPIPTPTQETLTEVLTSSNGRKKSGKSKLENSVSKARRNSIEELTGMSDSEVPDSAKPSKKKKKRKSEKFHVRDKENDEKSDPENEEKWDPANDLLQVADPLKIEPHAFAETESGDCDMILPVVKKKKKSRWGLIDDDLMSNVDHQDSDHSSSDNSPASHEFYNSLESFRKKTKKKSSRS